MKLIRLILATTPALLLATVTPPVRSASPEFYVAPHGADTWSGTRPEPNPDNGEVFTRNLVVWREGPLIKERDWWSFATLWDYNLHWQSRGEPIRFMRYTFDEWKAKGLGVHSVIADPLFVDPAKRDFRLRPESPAFKLGFRPIDLSDVGPRQAR